jgi:conjugal transfer pilus assembly protein TraW
MRYFSLLIIFLTFPAIAQSNGEDWVAEMLKQKEAATQQMKSDGSLRQFQPNRVESDMSKFIKDARQIADNSQPNMEQIQQAANSFFGNTAAEIDAFQSESSHTSLPAKSKSLSAIFVSFSMTDSELRDAFTAAYKHGAEVYFNGMHDDDENIMDTMNRIKQMMSTIDAKPHARFNPKAFTELSVKQVPTIFHAVQGNVGYVSGLMNFSWLKRQMETTVGLNNFGKQGSTSYVAEENIIHVLQQRMMSLDMEDKKQKAVDGFWGKQKFVTIPNNKEEQVFYINPTVKVSKDIVNPNGDVLASAGQVMNPLTTAPSKNTYYLFDANNEAHVNWALSRVDKSLTQGIQMFMTSGLDKDKGWEQLSSLRQSFSREIYLIPQQMVDRFKITGLPAIVSTDNNKGLLKIHLIDLQESL